MSTVVELYVGRQHGGESMAYVGRTEWDHMRRDVMEGCEAGHTEAQIAAALAEGLDAGIEECAEKHGFECTFYLDQTITLRFSDGVVFVSEEVAA